MYLVFFITNAMSFPYKYDESVFYKYHEFKNPSKAIYRTRLKQAFSSP